MRGSEKGAYGHCFGGARCVAAGLSWGGEAPGCGSNDKTRVLEGRLDFARRSGRSAATATMLPCYHATFIWPNVGTMCKIPLSVRWKMDRRLRRFLIRPFDGLARRQKLFHREADDPIKE